MQSEEGKEEEKGKNKIELLSIFIAKLPRKKISNNEKESFIFVFALTQHERTLLAINYSYKYELTSRNLGQSKTIPQKNINYGSS